jgi:SnoaL-like protein
MLGVSLALFLAISSSAPSKPQGPLVEQMSAQRSAGTDDRTAAALHADANPDDRRSVEAFWRQWFETVEAGNPDALADLLDDQFVWKGPAGLPITDKRVFKENVAALFARVRQGAGA